MATWEAKATVDASGRAGAASSNLVGKSVSTAATAASDGTDGTAFTAALAVLVADGASPTQAHVTTCNNAWTTYKADIDAATAAAAAITADVSVYVGSLTNVGTRAKFRAAMASINNLLKGSNIMTDGTTV